MKTYIKDLDGALIEVTDLNEALKQVAFYISFLYDVPSEEQAAFAKKRQRYWKDLFQKLGALKNDHLSTRTDNHNN
ncbi:hypothetical protein ASU31_10685 [Pedobacter ginsenosidimutans]|uniref:3-isopropylmalate dehydratase n=1 Tax=Pedobacter ginsenosidimutans TaxID=687842 RepID=A0A0T5VQ01_9SPHI|nr:hypothetical protein [Pedobacter ginsenosidimutans]KRT15966.1 hypothetical protein ASU31_10685 [Pedobacter ginsenosidimutans]